MSWLNIIVMGLLGTGFLTLVTVGAARLGLVRGSMLSAIGTFVIPEPMRRPALSISMHFLAGIGFAAVYAYIFAFVTPDQMSDYQSIGMLIGLVHGFFVSYFMMLGISSLQRGDDVRPFSFSAAALNVLAHVTFGLVVGTGLGYEVLMGRPWVFAAYAAASLLAVVGLAYLLAPHIRHIRHLRHRRDHHRPAREDRRRAAREAWQQTPAIERGP